MVHYCITLLSMFHLRSNILYRRLNIERHFSGLRLAHGTRVRAMAVVATVSPRGHSVHSRDTRRQH